MGLDNVGMQLDYNVKNLNYENPDKYVLYTAIDQIKNPEKIKTFYIGYVKFLMENFKSNEKNPESEALENIKDVVSKSYSKETCELWMTTLGNIEQKIDKSIKITMEVTIKSSNRVLNK